MPAPSDPTRVRPVLLALEDRTVPAGNVTARVIDGTLFVDGDAAANAVTIAGTGWQSVAVRPGDNDTTVNGLPGGAGVFLGDITRGIVVRGGDGEDTLRLEGVRNRHYIGVFAGGGEDEVVLAGVEAKGAVEIVGGVADDVVRLENSHFRKTVSVDLGTGDDRVEATGSRFRDRSFLSGGEGDDAFGRTDSRFSRAVSYTLFETVTNGPLPPVSVPDDGLAPSAAITSPAGESTAAERVPFSISFSEPVSGFDPTELGVTNGTLADFAVVSDSLYTVNVIPTEDGAITLSLPANVVTDASGQGNTAAAPLTVRSIRTDAGMSDTAPAESDPNFVPTGSGLAVWDVQVGSGTAVTADDTVTVFYSGWLTDGTLFDSARTDGQPATFPLSNLIAGFREGMVGMQPGGIRRFRIPPELGYGAAGSPPNIPSNATLLFEVKLAAVS